MRKYLLVLAQAATIFANSKGHLARIHHCQSMSYYVAVLVAPWCPGLLPGLPALAYKQMVRKYGGSEAAVQAMPMQDADMVSFSMRSVY